MATSQHRCVFVGNIPYDATEEQLIRICEEVGPVVSFRLVIDRETGKPKGYGFCEYKDEETALSARRNLQGYEINGRQLRVDFAENDKNMDKSREQGHGGPGLSTNIGDNQKQVGAQAGRPGSGLQQLIGLPVAMAAANVMAGALGGAQIAAKPTQFGLENQPGFGSDPLTMHLSKMSRNQLIDIIAELKVLATENKEKARQLLLATPLLPKAIFQAQVILGVVTPQMLQMPNIRASFSSGQGQQSGVQPLPSFPPLAQNNLHSDLMLKSQEVEVPAVQLPILSQSKYQQQGPAPVLPGTSTVFPPHSQNMMNMSARPHIQAAATPYAKQQVQPYMFQHQSQAVPAKLGHNNSQLVHPQGIREPFLSSSLNVDGVPNYTSTEYVRPPQLHNNTDRETYQRLPQGLSEKATMINNNQDTVNRPSKLLKLNDGRSTSFPADVNMYTSVNGPSQVTGMYSSHPKPEEASTSEKQTSQLPLELDSAILQQVLSLTPEQLSSLPPDQQQQVIQLQQMLRLS
ncbi:cleavage stimulating factor 64 isoform X2 [Daucus carota subsp. sativus]|uniref:cleavage stimulating factor 64 isoform X2 n=1 Tax=Daucus carota subsp. sativus TaxID=79200 RepID=UPI0007B28B0C|nr:PREDICTED: cleavage stimulating factor 64 isoform X2 [Daucus carota subsp. sativus]